MRNIIVLSDEDLKKLNNDEVVDLTLHDGKKVDLMSSTAWWKVSGTSLSFEGSSVKRCQGLYI